MDSAEAAVIEVDPIRGNNAVAAAGGAAADDGGANDVVAADGGPHRSDYSCTHSSCCGGGAEAEVCVATQCYAVPTAETSAGRATALRAAGALGSATTTLPSTC